MGKGAHQRPFPHRSPILQVADFYSAPVACFCSAVDRIQLRGRLDGMRSKPTARILFRTSRFTKRKTGLGQPIVCPTPKFTTEPFWLTQGLIDLLYQNEQI